MDQKNKINSLASAGLQQAIVESQSSDNENGNDDKIELPEIVDESEDNEDE